MVQLGEGSALVALEATDSMVVDAQGLVHGGFVFGLADYAAMMAVNDPNVVLGAAQVRFLKPVRTTETLTAVAHVADRDGRRKTVQVEVLRAGESVMSGEFVCHELQRHVLETNSS